MSHPTSPSRRSRLPVAAIAVPVVIFLCWALPRLVVAVFGIGGHWTPFAYQYAMGGLVFVIGLWVIRASGACDWSNARDRFWFRVLVFGYLAYAALHGVVTWLAAAVPFKGAA